MNMDVDRLLNIEEFPADWFAEGFVQIIPTSEEMRRLLYEVIREFECLDGLIGVSPPYRV